MEMLLTAVSFNCEDATMIRMYSRQWIAMIFVAQWYVVASVWSTVQCVCQDLPQDVPRLLSFQGVLLRKDGTLYQDGTFNITVELYDAEKGGAKVYSSSIPVVVVRGVFNVIVGEQNSLKSVDFTRQLWVDMKAPDALPFEHRTKLTSAPYAVTADHAVVAGSLSPDAPDVVRNLNGLSGNLLIEGGPGVTIEKTDKSLRIDAARMLDMMQLVAADPAVLGISRRQSRDSVTGEMRTIIEVSLKDSALTKKYLSRTDAGTQNNGVSYTADSISFPRYNVDLDGRITSIESVRVPRVPTGYRANRVMLSDRDGKIVESEELSTDQVLMGRANAKPTPVRIRAGPGVKIQHTSSKELLFSIDESYTLASLRSGRYTNNTDRYQYETNPIDVRTGNPMHTDAIGPTARILVSLESASSSTSVTITNRTDSSFTVALAGGLAPGASINWMVIDNDK